MSSSILGVATSCLFNGIAIFVVWTYREKFLSPRHSLDCIYEWWLLYTEPGPACCVERRVVIIDKCLATMKSVTLAFLVLGALSYEWMGGLDKMHSPVGLVLVAFLYVLFCARGSLPLTERNMNAFFVLWSVIIAAYTFVAPAEKVLVCSGLRLASRTLLSIIFMKSQITTPINLLSSLAVCWVYRQHEIFDESPFPNHMTVMCLVEMLAWLVGTAGCVILEISFKDFLRTEEAAERLLSGFCDSVVRLDKDLRIVHATPQLMHLLSPTNPVDPRVLEKTLFSSHLATDADTDKYAAFICGNASPAIASDTGMLRVNMHHALGHEVFVEIFHVHLNAIDRDFGHWFAIREIRREGNAPDESLFEGMKKDARPPPAFLDEAQKDGSDSDCRDLCHSAQQAPPKNDGEGRQESETSFALTVSTNKTRDASVCTAVAAGRVKGMEAVLTALMDNVVWLGSDHCFYGVDERRDVFMNQPVEGKLFSDLLVAKDHQPFRELLEQVRLCGNEGNPEHHPFTFHSYGRSINGTLVAIAVGSKYLIGISLEKRFARRALRSKACGACAELPSRMKKTDDALKQTELPKETFPSTALPSILLAEDRTTTMHCKGVQTEKQKGIARPPKPPSVIPTKRCFQRDFKGTDRLTIEQMLLQVLVRLNPRGKGCCFYHIGLVTLHKVMCEMCAIACLHKIKPNSAWQCENCHAVLGASDDEGDECPVCGHEGAASEDGDGSPLQSRCSSASLLADDERSDSSAGK